MATDELEDLRSRLERAEAELDTERRRRVAAEDAARTARTAVDEAAVLVQRLAEKTSGPPPKKARLLSVVLTLLVILSFVTFLGALYWVNVQGRALRETQRRSLHSFGDTSVAPGPGQISSQAPKASTPACAPCPPCPPPAGPPGAKAPDTKGMP